MRPTRRLEDNAWNRMGSRPAVPAAASLPHPQTPHRLRSNPGLDNLIRELDNEWQLGLTRGQSQLRSPAHNRTAADRTYRRIQHLFYSARPALDDVLQDFGRTARAGLATEAPLDVLHDMLKSRVTPGPPSRTGTPKNVPPKSLLTSNPTTPNTTFLHRCEEADSHYTAAPEPGSSTEEDDDDFETPPSPTPSSRRKQASTHFIRPNPRKRPSDSSNDSGLSPKLTRTAKGKQSVDIQPYAKPGEQLPFKVPTLDMATSLHAATITTATTSANTSFNASVSSSQQTRADTVNTSFTSHDGASERDFKMTRTSSMTMGSLGDQDLLYVGTKLESQIDNLNPGSSQANTRESTSTYGSMDEPEFAAAIEKAETLSLPITKPGLPLPSPFLLQTNSPQKAPSAHKETLTRSHSTHGAPPLLDGTTDAPPNETVSPLRKAWYIREIPTKNLFVDRLPVELKAFSYHLLFICCRIAEAHAISMLDLMHGLNPFEAQSDANAFWKRLEDHPQVSKIALRESGSAWAAARKSFEGFSFKGKLVFNLAASKSAFKLELLPIHSETSCQLQRQFGSDRFLYLTVPSFSANKPERFTSTQMQEIQEEYNAWLSETHFFLGRSWRVFHIQPIKRKGETRKDDNAETRLVLFAVDGIGIDRPLLVGQMLDEYMPLDVNKDQNFCKAIARIDLGLSKTIPTLMFLPSQIRQIRDTYSDGTPEATEFDDDNLSWAEKANGPQVMNDGCSRISVGAALMIWKQYRKVTGSEDPFPSAIQGRIGGAKGMWIISGEPQTRSPEDLDVWIEITDSQLKFEPPWEDRADDRRFNKHRLTFNLLKYSQAASATDLHISFIPILVDRGVLKSVVAKLMTDRLDDERRALLDMVSDPVTLYNWVTREGAATKDAGNVRWQAALPLSLPDKVKHLLRSGFNPEQAPYLASVLGRFLKQRQTWMEQKLRAPLGKATFMYGVTDPSGLLRPGEVHVHFSTPFTDKYTGNSYRNLNGLEILLARQPACRRSDIQKVRVACSPELSHLVNVVVFPTRGEYPLAGKLQGGDYDGDIFWTCWEDCLVEPFRNAPAPMAPLDPSKYGITTDRRKVHEVMDTKNLSTVDSLLKETFKFRTAPSLLGKATNFLEKVSYKENRICSAAIDALCDIHDLLVDATKQAYTFTEKDYTKLVRFELKCGNPKMPAYKEAMEANAKVKENEGGKSDQKKIRHNPDNVLDYLFFDVFQAHNIETMNHVNTRLCKVEDDDPELRLPYLRLLNSAGSDLTAELNDLVNHFSKVRDKWNGLFGNGSAMSLDQYTKALDAVYDQFRAIEPSSKNAFKEDIAPLIRSYYGPQHPTTWETIRASAFYCKNPTRHSLVWHMAGRELSRLKARSLPGTYDVVAPIFANLKPKPMKAPKPEDEEDEGPSNEYEDLSDEDFESTVEQLHG
ncbi:hypothetical protein CC86DRAFT_438904 [Ophiobolus disseminans]|uniref:RNA-dependent RNA polymerase n=1 Tax=Ophiobolus disseminans TaxID=1469910 RepID=A0A6A7A3W3_9PLEO|nr:hypothetical protein CC86DRAFT_438904 [Ophiobolus disseminans]